MVVRDLHPPRIVDGAGGPLIASFEHARADDDWQLVLVAPGGATRVAAELGGAGEPVRSTAEPRTPRSSLSGRGTDASFDAVGSQILIAGTVVETQTDDRDGTPTVLLLDLAEGTWSRVPVEAAIATFDRTGH